MIYNDTLSCSCQWSELDSDTFKETHKNWSIKLLFMLWNGHPFFCKRFKFLYSRWSHTSVFHLHFCLLYRSWSVCPPLNHLILWTITACVLWVFCVDKVNIEAPHVTVISTAGKPVTLQTCSTCEVVVCLKLCEKKSVQPWSKSFFYFTNLLKSVKQASKREGRRVNRVPFVSLCVVPVPVVRSLCGFSGFQAWCRTIEGNINDQERQSVSQVETEQVAMLSVCRLWAQTVVWFSIFTVCDKHSPGQQHSDIRYRAHTHTHTHLVTHANGLNFCRMIKD